MPGECYPNDSGDDEGVAAEGASTFRCALDHDVIVSGSFAVTGNTSVFNTHAAGWVIMIVGLVGLLLPRRNRAWLGRRVVSLLWRDDLDTAFRHLDLYDRFGCPAGHIQATFRCVVRQGSIDPKADPKATDTINGRVHSCWINPNV